jgi:hypothetical protein
MSTLRTYGRIMIGSNNQPTLTFSPPVDLTYPPDGMPMPIARAIETRGVAITRQRPQRA